MRRILGTAAIGIGIGLLLTVFWLLQPSNAATTEVAWEKTGSTLAFIVAREQQGIPTPASSEAHLDLIQAKVHAEQAVQVSVRFDRELARREIDALEAELGIEFHRLDGQPAHVGAIYGITVPLAQMGALSQKSSVVQIELLNKPVASPLDVSIPLIGADQAWSTQDWAGRDIRGKGVRIANFDTGVDVYHPDFWYADGGTCGWWDPVNITFAGDGTECVDFNGNKTCDSGETLRYFEIAGTAASSAGTPGVFEADVDWLYNDANGDSVRNYRPPTYTESSPTYGERIFLVDDANLNNTLDPGEKVIALGTSKIYATLDWQGNTHLRGTDLITSDADYNGHGTGVAGVALGGSIVNISGTYAVPNRRFVGVAPEAELLCADRINNGYTTYIPWAANLGADVMLYEFGGWIAEFMDGSSNMEQMMDAQAAAGVVQVVPAGNLAGSNKEDTQVIPGGGSQVFTANLSTLTSISRISMAFLWRDPTVDVTYTITAPNGISSTVLAATTGGSWAYPQSFAGRTIWYRRLDSSRGTAKYDLWIDGSLNTGQSWLIQANNPSGTPLTIYAYITDNYYQWSGGMVWINPNETKTVCWPATADSAIGVASYSTRAKDTVSVGDLSSFSSRGSRVDDTRILDIAAPGGMFEVIAAETRSSGANAVGKYQWFGGTSAAGPHVAGTAALMLQKNPTLTPTQVTQIIRTTAFTDSWTNHAKYGGSTPNDYWGWGKLNVAGAVQSTPPPSPDFSLGVTPAWQTITASSNTTYTVGITAQYGFTSSVTLSVGGLPTAATASWSRNPITSAITSTLHITTTMAMPGDYSLVITGTGGGLTHTTRPTLTVMGPILSISKTAPLTAVYCTQLTYTLRAENTGNAPATSVVVTDAVPSGAGYVRCQGGTCGESNGVVTWSGLTLPPGQSVSVSFTVNVNSGPLVNNSYRVASSAEGASSPWGAPITVTAQAPNVVAAFTPASTTIPINTPVVFTDTSTTDGSAIAYWNWDFGDGGTGNSSVVSHTFTAIGTYTVTLSVGDVCGYGDQIIVSNAVQVDSRIFLPLLLSSYP
jgi:uncharacterized repeat protein (TIGR01451 family)